MKKVLVLGAGTAGTVVVNKVRHRLDPEELKLPGTDVGMANMLAGLPGMTRFATGMMKREMDKLAVPAHREFMQMVHDAGAKFWACRLSFDMLANTNGLTKDDLWEGVEDVISANDFMELSEGRPDHLHMRHNHQGPPERSRRACRRGARTSATGGVTSCPNLDG